MSKRLTVVYEVPDDYNVTRITGTGELNVVRCEWMDALERLAAAEAVLARIALHETGDDSESDFAKEHLGWPNTSELWDIIKAANGGRE